MKKHVVILAVLSFILFGCGGVNNSKENDSSVKTEEAELIEESKSIDSISMEMDKAKEEIEESSEKLDELLKDL